MGRDYYACDNPTEEEVQAARTALEKVAQSCGVIVFRAEGESPVLQRGGPRVIADHLGVDEVTVRSWWRGDRRMPATRIAAIHASTVHAITVP